MYDIQKKSLTWKHFDVFFQNTLKNAFEMRIYEIDAYKQGTFFQNQGTFFAKLGHTFSVLKTAYPHSLPSCATD